MTRSDFEQERDTYTEKFFLEYDTNQSFFNQYLELLKKTPLPILFGGESTENCEFTDTGGYAKNVYLSFVYGGSSENVCYTRNTKSSKNVYNSCAVWSHNENIYQSVAVTDYSYHVFFSK